ncbi:hypothetical protein HN903_02535 [archaeon]|jgi:hypothetical protein|nr:hypothetical protein [archaeon]MBT7128609.1 hypothetical protein [archaeon]
MPRTLEEEISLTVVEFKNGAIKNTLFEDVNNKIISDSEAKDIDEDYLQYERDWNSIANTTVGTEER